MEPRYIALIVSACIIVIAVSLIIVKYHFRNDPRFNKRKNKDHSNKNNDKTQQDKNEEEKEK